MELFSAGIWGTSLKQERKTSVRGMKSFVFLIISILFLSHQGIAYSDVKMGRGVKSPTDINKAIKENPNADLYNIRGNQMLMDGKYKEAITDFNMAISINPRYAEPYNGMGIAYRNIGDYKKAIDSYSRAIDLYPKYVEAYNNRGITYMYLQKDKEMCRDFLKACEYGDCSKMYAARKKGLCR